MTNFMQFYTEEESKEALDSLLLDLNNIIVNYLEGLPDWCYLGNTVKATHPAYIIHQKKELFGEIIAISTPPIIIKLQLTERFNCTWESGVTTWWFDIENCQPIPKCSSSSSKNPRKRLKV
jgi:hypothetical protein